ncbi:MAG: hypothetical protein DCF19_04310 [Pseudanabaena frigida]|uniref:DUF5117 domain-containing protein n=1 Tax=Pseudanabaena frigida TaxID=945775 RepID=A0A2W4WKZ9_9CYAN|nr:MAG: hypothetical protein DCF19_04310 [Pseudanabaena frigida]
MNIFHKNFRAIHRTSVSLFAATLTTIPFLSTLDAIAAPSVPQIVAQVPQDWQTGVQILRLLDNSGNLSSIGILFDVANKPTTTYANVVYQLYVKRAGEWREVYTNSGARLLSKTAGRYFTPVEVISLSRLSEKISLDDIYNGDLKAITSVRYDLPNGVKDSRFEIEEVKSFTSLVTVRESEITARRVTSVYTTASNSSNNTSISNNSTLSDRDLGISNGSQTTSQTTVIQTSTVQSTKPIIVTRKDYDDEDDDYDGDDRKDRKDRRDQEGVEMSKKNPHRGHFRLAVLQSQPRFSEVIARISIKSKSSKKFIKERFIGDYRFPVNQRANFIGAGVNPGDRIIVRLFDLQNRPLGYSEFQLLKNFANVNLILPSDPSAYGTLRTVSGIDSQRIGQIDRNVKIYDYFTQIQTSTVLTQTVARFLPSSQGIPLGLFNVAGLPQASNQCTYTNAFAKGENSLVDRAIDFFTPEMPPVMQVLPGQLTALIPIDNSLPTFDMIRKILDYKDLRPNNIPTLF